jgi:hypothetical protein
MHSGREHSSPQAAQVARRTTGLLKEILEVGIEPVNHRDSFRLDQA